MVNNQTLTITLLSGIFLLGSLDRTYQGAQGRVYRYPMFDVLTNKRSNKTYKAVYLENEYIKICVLPAAIASMEKAIECNSKDARLFYELDRLYETANRDLAKRLALLDKNSATIAKRDDSLTRQIVLQARSGQYDKAIKTLTGHHFNKWEGTGLRRLLRKIRPKTVPPKPACRRPLHHRDGSPRQGRRTKGKNPSRRSPQTKHKPHMGGRNAVGNQIRLSSNKVGNFFEDFLATPLSLTL